jgi:hypothetical protein
MISWLQGCEYWTVDWGFLSKTTAFLKIVTSIAEVIGPNLPNFIDILICDR